MKNMVLSLLLLASTTVVASTELDGLSLNGMAVFSELKRPVYLAALYVEYPESDAQLIIDSDEIKAMELTIAASRWSSRRFSEQWSRSLLINNDLNYLKRYDVEVIEFSGVMKGSLKQGDRVIFSRGSKGETVVTLNGIQLLKLDKPGFYEMVLKVWIGARPPSSDFKAKLLSKSADAQLMDLHASLEPSEERIDVIAAWLEPPEDNDKAIVAAAVAVPAVAVIAAPKTASAAPSASAVAAAEAAKRAEAIEIASLAEQEVAAKIEAIAQIQAQEVVEEDQEFQADEQNKLLELYQSMVVRGVLSKVKYPSVAVKRNLQGTAMLELTVNRKGEIVSVVFLEKTRYKRLNQAAEKAVADVGQFPAVPEALEGDEVSVKLPVKFILS